MKLLFCLPFILGAIFPGVVHSEGVKKELIEKKGVKIDIKIDHKKEIVFGQTGSFSGPFKIYGEMIRNAISACFKRVNEQGGINGKQLRLISFDDNGKADLFADNINMMKSKFNIDMFLGCMGTRGVLKVLPDIKKGLISMFFPWGGDEKLQDSTLKFLVNGLGLIFPQTEELIRHIVEDLRLNKIAIFHSDGDFSKTNTQVAIEQLNAFGLEPVSVASYNKFTLDVKKTAYKLIDSDPKVVLCISPSQPAVKLIDYFFRSGNFGARFFGIDSTMFVGDILKTKGVNFHYASSVPNPNDKTISIVKNYQESLTKFYPEEPFNILSLAYFIQAMIVVEALRSIEGEITKESVIKNIEDMEDFDLNGFNVNFNLSNRYAFGDNISIIKG